jgi:hypothetical protein
VRELSIGLTLVGAASPIKRAAIVRAFGKAAKRLPEDYVELLEEGGPGELCGFVELPDPTVKGGRHASLVTALRERGPAARSRGLWPSVSDAELLQAAVLGIDRRGAVLIALDSEDLRFLDSEGGVQEVGSFHDLVRRFLRYWEDHRRSGLASALSPGPGGYTSLSTTIDLDVPEIYATTPRPSDAVFAALERGDQAAVDTALEALRGREVLPFAWLALIDRLLGPDGASIAAGDRGSMIPELFTLANREMPGLGERIAVRELRRAVSDDAVRETTRAKFQAICHLPASTIFDGDAQAADVASDVMPGAADRGLIAPVGFVVDTEARLREFIAAWEVQDPATSLAPVLEHIARLHPTQRSGYTMLLAQTRWNEGNHPSLSGAPDAEDHLEREATDAWAHLVLALRSTEDHESYQALELLHEASIPEALPYLRSVVEHEPPYVISYWNAERVYAELAELDGEGTKALLLPFLTSKRKASPRRRTAAFEALVEHADDDRVLEVYLANYAAALPHSEDAIEQADRWDDARVLPALREALRAEEKFLLAGNADKDDITGGSYEDIARRLAKLGDEDGKAALKKVKRAMKRAERDF